MKPMFVKAFLNDRPDRKTNLLGVLSQRRHMVHDGYDGVYLSFAGDSIKFANYIQLPDDS